MNFHSPAQGDTTWYHGKDLLKVTSRNIRMEESGYYQCKTQRSSFSDPVLVEFSSGEERKGASINSSHQAECQRTGLMREQR
jgi:hypothetical protein